MKEQQNINIDISNSTEIVCSECGNKTFNQVYLLRKISAVLSPTGQELLIPIMVYECSGCSKIVESTMPVIDEN